MFNIKNLTIKNFLSVGAVTQTVNFEKQGFMLIIGNNMDQGGNGARNGVGKSTIIQALSYVLFDATITKIGKDNMVNMVNNKNMLVTVEFEVGENHYRIERGRKPSVLRVFVNGEDEDKAHGENRYTQPEIEKLIGMSHDMFKNIMALSTYNVPFLSMTASNQRSLIEELMGITQLSLKASVLKKELDNNKSEIKSEEVRIETQLSSNEAVMKSIDKLRLQSEKFEDSKAKTIIDLDAAISNLSDIDIEREIELHKQKASYQEAKNDVSALTKRKSSLVSQIGRVEKVIEKLGKDLEKAETNVCPTCKQKMKDHGNLVEDITNDILTQDNVLKPLVEELQEVEEAIKLISVPDVPDDTTYDNIDDAYSHKQNLNTLTFQLEEEAKKENPYTDQIKELEDDAIVEIDYSVISQLKDLVAHQEFLYKLLTNKDSFIRKKIIDQNIAYLNTRIQFYLNQMGLPHKVDFKNDLNVEIMLLGQNFDFGQLSRGQQNRLVLAFSWAFRDVWESTGHHSNLLFIDEMIDSGLDTSGAESTLSILKKMARERSKDIFLISHKEELLTRVDNVLTVTMENGFTSYDQNV